MEIGKMVTKLVRQPKSGVQVINMQENLSMESLTEKENATTKTETSTQVLGSRIPWRVKVLYIMLMVLFIKVIGPLTIKLTDTASLLMEANIGLNTKTTPFLVLTRESTLMVLFYRALLRIMEKLMVLALMFLQAVKSGKETLLITFFREMATKLTKEFVTKLSLKIMRLLLLEKMLVNYHTEENLRQLHTPMKEILLRTKPQVREFLNTLPVILKVTSMKDSL